MSRHIIDGKRYDTETATLIGEASFSHHGDFHYWEESLYKTAKGAFFIVGEGGALSRYARRVDTNSSCGGSGVRALTPAEALEWAEHHHIDPDVLAEYFADLIQEA